jgi:hypothetical protein
MDGNTEDQVDKMLVEIAELLGAKVTHFVCVDKRHESQKIVIEYGERVKVP